LAALLVNVTARGEISIDIRILVYWVIYDSR